MALQAKLLELEQRLLVWDETDLREGTLGQKGGEGRRWVARLGVRGKAPDSPLREGVEAQGAGVAG